MKIKSIDSFFTSFFISLFFLCFFNSTANAKIFPTRFSKQISSHSITRNTTRNTTDRNTADKLLYFGGPVISHVKVVTVFWGSKVDPATVANINTFYSAITNSDHLDWLNQYRTQTQEIGRGSVVASVTITPRNSGTKLDKKAVEEELVYQIDQGKLPRPDANTLFMMHFPAGMTLLSGGQASCQAWCGDHEGFTSTRYGNIYYAMMPDLGGACYFGCNFSNSVFNSLTVIASHELVEAITDPLCPDIGMNPAFPAAWLAADQNEIGDLCASTKAELSAGPIKYRIQGEWDNSSNQCKGGHWVSSIHF